MTAVDCQTCIHILEIITTNYSCCKLALRYCIDSKLATSESAAAAAAARYHAAVGWLCKGTFTAQPKDRFALVQQCHCFSVMTSLIGRPEEHLGDKVLMWLSVWSEVQIVLIWSSICFKSLKPIQTGLCMLIS